MGEDAEGGGGLMPRTESGGNGAAETAAVSFRFAGLGGNFVAIFSLMFFGTSAHRSRRLMLVEQEPR